MRPPPRAATGCALCSKSAKRPARPRSRRAQTAFQSFHGKAAAPLSRIRAGRSSPTATPQQSSQIPSRHSSTTCGARVTAANLCNRSGNHTKQPAREGLCGARCRNRIGLGHPVAEVRPLQLDDRMKQLLRELGHAINDSVSESDRIAEAIAGVRAAGFDIVLKLDATIGLARRNGSQDGRITHQDRRFLESLHISVDEELLEEVEEEESKVEITPQDIKFLKSLKISFEEDR